MSAIEFHTAATAMIARLRAEAKRNDSQWQKDGIQSPLGPLVIVEYVSGVNEAYRINGGAPVCTHWQGASAINDVMRAAGYVRQ